MLITNDIVLDKENGAIVGYGDHQALAQEMIKLFKDQELMQKMSDGAYQSSERYSNENVWQAWQELIADAERTLKGDVSK